MIGKLSWTALAASLASAGLGLLLWLGISIALLQGSGTEMVVLRSMQHAGLLLACVLALAAVYTCILLPPARARTRWRQLAIGALVLALASTAALMVLLTRKPPDVGWVELRRRPAEPGCDRSRCWPWACGSPPVAAQWRQQVVAPSHLAYALLAGAALLFALIAVKWPGQEMLSTPAPSMVMLLVVMGVLEIALLVREWRPAGAGCGASGTDHCGCGLRCWHLLVLVPLLLCAGLILWPGLAPKTGWCVIALAVLAGGYRDCQLLATEAGFPTASAELPGGHYRLEKMR